MYKSLERVTSSGEVSEGCVVFRVLNDVPAVIGNTDNLFHIRFISGDAFSIKRTVPLVSEIEKIYSGTLMPFKGKIPVDSKTLISTPMEATSFQANPMRSAMLYRVITRCGVCFIQGAAAFLKSLFTGPKKHLFKGYKA
jgi:hypothetical protein